MNDHPSTRPEQHPDRYDEIGLSYDATRRAEPRIEAQIRSALGARSPVVNAGAGTGSHEGACAEAIAVEPSSEMIARRPPGSAAVLQAVAEHLPLDEIARELPGARMDVVPIPKDYEDGFLCAWWARPQAYLDPVVRDGISCFPGMENVERQAGLLAEDLASGAWQARYGALLEREAVDFGYRLVVWDQS